MRNQDSLIGLFNGWTMDWKWKPMEPTAPRIGLKDMAAVWQWQNRAISKFVKSVVWNSSSKFEFLYVLLRSFWKFPFFWRLLLVYRRSERWWDTNREILLEVLLVSFSGLVNILLGWWEKTHIFFWKFHPQTLGKKDSQFDLRIFFVGGLVQPPTGINSLHARSLA